MSKQKDLFNEINRNRSDLHELTGEEMKKVHDALLVIAHDIFSVCERHGIRAMLYAGSALGAVRHNGFIPWDDDIDITMPRKDYERFKEVFDGELGEKYSLLAPNYRGGAMYSMAKVESRRVMITNDMGQEHGLCVDIFPLDNVPDNNLRMRLRGLRASFLIAAGAQVKYYRTISKEAAARFFKNSKHKYIHYIKKIAGWLLSWRSAEQWYNLADRCCAFPDENTKRVTIPTGREHYFGGLYRREDMVLTEPHAFETETFPIPAGWDSHLTALYGDWRVIPPENKRERHFIMGIEFLE